MPVYIIRVGTDGPVKIGRSNNPDVRLAVLQTAHHSPLNLIRTIEGGAVTESWLHARFATSRILGEWFDFDATMLSIVPPSEASMPGPRTFSANPWVPGENFATAPEIEAALHERKLTVAAMCRAAGCTADTFFRWRSGANEPSVETVRKMVSFVQQSRHPAPA